MDDHPLLKKSKLHTLKTVTTFLTAILVLLFFIWMMDAVMKSDASADPLFFPIKPVLYIVWIMATVINIMLMGLHALRIKWTTDEKEALWHVNDYGTGAKGLIAVSIVLIVLFGYPPIMNMIDDQMDKEDTEPSATHFSYEFSSGDALDVTHAHQVEVYSSGNPFNVSIYTKESVRENPDFSGPHIAHRADVTMYVYDEDLDPGNYYMLITSEDGATVTYTVYKTLDRELIGYFVWFPIILLIANIVWAIALFALRQRVIRSFVIREQTKMQKAFTIEEVFLIYKDGRLIAHNARRLKADVDKDILTGMLTAVQSFVAESFQKDEIGVLDEMHYGNFRILIENGPYANMAVVVHGEEPPDMRRKIKHILNEVHQMYGSYLASWDGDTTALNEAKKVIGEITPPMPPQAGQDVVEEVFLLHRDNRFIYHVTQRLGPDIDDELLRETMEYITERVGPNLNASVQSLPHSVPYGDWTIITEYGPDVYLAALLSGPEPKGFRAQMQRVLEEVSMTYGQVLYQWDGEMEGLKELRKPMDSMFIRMQLRGKRGRRR